MKLIIIIFNIFHNIIKHLKIIFLIKDNKLQDYIWFTESTKKNDFLIFDFIMKNIEKS